MQARETRKTGITPELTAEIFQSKPLRYSAVRGNADFLSAVMGGLKFFGLRPVMGRSLFILKGEKTVYKSISPNLNFVEEEKKVERFWEDENIFEKSIAEREGDKPYVFYDGPPTANGKPHIGHVLTRVIKDMIPRYRTMKGYMVPRKAGWDTHGLPVELPDRPCY